MKTYISKKMIKFFKDFIQSIIKLFGFKVSTDTNFKYDNRFRFYSKRLNHSR